MQRNKRYLMIMLLCLLSGCRADSDADIGKNTEMRTEGAWESVDESRSDAVRETDTASDYETDVGTGVASDMETNASAASDDSMKAISDTEANTGVASNDGTNVASDTKTNLEATFDDGTNAEAAFYYTALSEEIRARITGKSYPDTEEPLQISYEDLAYVHVLHYDFQMQVQEGELVCNQSIAQDLVDIFYELYESQYPIEKICLIDEYGADDEASMADNNTSCFNYRPVPGRTKLSNHAYGYAIDVNPLYNPYVRTREGQVLISPDNAVPYADRSADFAHKIDRDDLCYRIFIEHGFSWGGAWNSSKDYQHFEKVP